MHKPIVETTSWELAAYSFSLIFALLICLVMSIVSARILQKYGRNDLLPWVVGGSLAVSLILGLCLLLPHLPYIVPR
jgi:hypothetical protein